MTTGMMDAQVDFIYFAIIKKENITYFSNYLHFW